MHFGVREGGLGFEDQCVEESLLWAGPTSCQVCEGIERGFLVGSGMPLVACLNCSSTSGHSPDYISMEKKCARP